MTRSPPRSSPRSPVAAAWRRVLALAGVTWRDLFSGQGLLLALLLIAGAFLADGDLQATTASEAAALRLEQRITLVGWLASAAALLGGAHVLAEDRRTRQLEQWRATPLRVSELLVGRWLGTVAGVAGGALLVLLFVLSVPASALLRHRDELAPRARVTPTRVSATLADGNHFDCRAGPLLLDAGTRLTITFAPLSAAASDFAAAIHSDWELVIPLRGARDDRGATSVDLAVLVDGKERFVEHGGAPYELRVSVACPVESHTVELITTDHSSVVRVELDRVVLRGPPGSLLPSVARAAAGLVVEVALAAALGVALATVLADLYAIAGGATLLLLCNLRALFLDVAHALDEPHARVAPALRASGQLIERLVVALPDLTELRAGDRLARGLAPWSGADLRFGGVALAFIAGSLAVGALLLRRRRWSGS